jgi:uncharacterized membrane protein YbhN (UPF0104 family)
VKKWARVVGLILLIVLLLQLDVGALLVALRDIDVCLLIWAVLLNVPMLVVKTVRWKAVLRTQGVDYAISKAALAYVGSIYLGLVTPGRVGEFAKALHVSQDCDIPIGRSLASALVDRLFDLYALLVVGGTALLLLSAERVYFTVLLVSVVLLLTSPLVLLLHDGAFGCVRVWGSRLRLLEPLFSPGSWFLELREGLLQLTLSCLWIASGLTVVAYVLFFSQCYLLALALGIPAGFFPISFSVALGSLATLLPISISGLGTREAAIVAYLGTAGVPEEVALGFSLTVFATFYLAGGLMGAISWWIKPVEVRQLSRMTRGKSSSVVE